jgi:hypothetical protein
MIPKRPALGLDPWVGTAFRTKIMLQQQVYGVLRRCFLQDAALGFDREQPGDDGGDRCDRAE